MSDDIARPPPTHNALQGLTVAALSANVISGLKSSKYTERDWVIWSFQDSIITCRFVDYILTFVLVIDTVHILRTLNVYRGL